jgi:hypothetical protein
MRHAINEGRAVHRPQVERYKDALRRQVARHGWRHRPNIGPEVPSVPPKPVLLQSIWTLGARPPRRVKRVILELRRDMNSLNPYWIH